MKCSAPVTASEAHDARAGKRRITIDKLTIDWGNNDLRDQWTGAYTFCSFDCLAKWATEKSLQHDDTVLTEGKP